jgi:hypothetical protein
METREQRENRFYQQRKTAQEGIVDRMDLYIMRINEMKEQEHMNVGRDTKLYDALVKMEKKLTQWKNQWEDQIFRTTTPEQLSSVNTQVNRKLYELIDSLPSQMYYIKQTELEEGEDYDADFEDLFLPDIHIAHERRHAYTGNGVKKPENKWVLHVKQYAQQHNISYREALSKAKPSYEIHGSGGGQSSMNRGGSLATKKQLKSVVYYFKPQLQVIKQMLEIIIRKRELTILTKENVRLIRDKFKEIVSYLKTTLLTATNLTVSNLKKVRAIVNEDLQSIELELKQEMDAVSYASAFPGNPNLPRAEVSQFPQTARMENDEDDEDFKNFNISDDEEDDEDFNNFNISDDEEDETRPARKASYTGNGVKKPENKWVIHVKEFASKHGIKYGDALKNPTCKATYRYHNKF